MILEGYKTYIAAICAFLIVLLNLINKWAQGQPWTETDITLLVQAFIALAMIFLRKGIKSNTQEVIKYQQIKTPETK